jgi:hypothetical protein
LSSLSHLKVAFARVVRPESDHRVEEPLGRWVERIAGCATALALSLTLTLVAAIPWSLYDSYAYNSWPRLMALHGGLQLSAVGPVYLHRPLFYVLEGQVWWLVGFHEWIGRALSFVFTATFVGAVVWLSDSAPRRLRRGVALLVLLLIVDVQRHAFDGLTDVPAAAMLALTAAFVWKLQPSAKRSVLIVLAAFAAVMTKPSGLLGAIALSLALLVGSTSEVRVRLKRSVAPIAAGALIGIAYDWVEAHRLHVALANFLQDGVGQDVWAQKAAASRPDGLYGWNWLGRPLHVLLVFSVAYAVLRLAGLRHTRAAILASPLAWFWALFGPSIAGSFAQETAHGPLTKFAAVAISACFPLVALAPEAAAPSRRQLGRLVVWTVPAVGAWLMWAAYDTRLVSAAWTPLALLIVEVVTLVILGAARLRPFLTVVPVGALLILFAYNMYNLDNLGRAGWRELQQGGVSSLTNHRFMENVALNQFQYELDAVRKEVGPKERILTADSRLSFFFPERVEIGYPVRCSEVQPFRAFVLLSSDESVVRSRAEGEPATPEDWEKCPGLTEVASIPGTFAVFVTGHPR